MNQERIANAFIKPPPSGTVCHRWVITLVSLLDINHLKYGSPHQISLPISQFCEDIEPFQKLSSVVVHYKPFVEYEYFKIGESYGESRETVVRNANTLVKNMIFIQEQKKYTFNQYMEEITPHTLIGDPILLNFNHGNREITGFPQ